MQGEDVCIIQVGVEVQHSGILLCVVLVLQEEEEGLRDVLREAEPTGGAVHDAHYPSVWHSVALTMGR